MNVTTCIQEITSAAATADSDVASKFRTPLQISLHDSSESDRWMQEWQRLEQRVAEPALMCSFAWTQTWLDHYGDLVPHRFAVGTIDGDVHGICLLTEGVEQKEGPFTLKTMHVGTAGEPERDTVWVEYNDVLATRKARREFLAQLYQIVLKEAVWDEFRLDGFARSAIEDVLPIDAGFLVKEQRAYYSDLRAARDDDTELLARFSKSTRKTIRKSLKRLGKVTLEWAETIEQAESIFEDLVRLHQARWNAVGEPGVYSSERFTNFHRNLIHRLFPLEQIALTRIRNEHAVLGCAQSLIDGNRVLSYQSGLAAPTGHQSPGVLCDFLEIQECQRRGFDAYDFMGGDSYHKQRMSTDSNTLVWLRQRLPSFRQKLIEPLRTMKSMFAKPSKDDSRRQTGGN